MFAQAIRRDSLKSSRQQSFDLYGPGVALESSNKSLSSLMGSFLLQDWIPASPPSLEATDGQSAGMTGQEFFPRS